jgi:hypothetical protein
VIEDGFPWRDSVQDYETSDLTKERGISLPAERLSTNKTLHLGDSSYFVKCVFLVSKSFVVENFSLS